MTARPTSREGTVALPDVALYLEHGEFDDVEKAPWLDRLVPRTFENARDAIKAGAGC